MTSFRITLSPSKRAAGRFISRVRRSLQRALVEEGKSQSDVARAIGVHRSVICRELQGEKDITLGRVGEIAWALGRRAVFELTPIASATETLALPIKPAPVPNKSAALAAQGGAQLPPEILKLLEPQVTVI